MRFCQIRAEYIPQKPGLQGIYEKIEQGGRTCYKSDDKTEYDENGNSLTAEAFAKKLTNVLKHMSVAEHATVYLKEPRRYEYEHNIELSEEPGDLWVLTNNPYSRATLDENYLYVTTNYRVILENGLEHLVEKYLCEPEPQHIKRHSIRVFTDRGVSAEMNRHRVNSPSERSTRYCNFSLNKFDNQIGIVVPPEFDYNSLLNYTSPHMFEDMCEDIVIGDTDDFEALDYWLFANLACEWSYNNLIEKCGWKPQQARRVLPLDLETELVVSAYEDDWIKFFGQRFYGSTGTPHPDMKRTAYEMILAFREGGCDDLIKRINHQWEQKPIEDPT